MFRQQNKTRFRNAPDSDEAIPAVENEAHAAVVEQRHSHDGSDFVGFLSNHGKNASAITWTEIE